jgi:hypothetical protein
MWVLVPFLFSICFSHLVKPIFQDKYILSVQPAMMLLLAYAIYSIWGTLLKLTGFVVAIGLMIVSSDTTPNPEGDWKNVVKYIKPLHNARSVVLIDPWYEFRTFSYYFNQSAFEKPDSTVKILSKNRVHTGWNDALGLIIQKQSGVIHLLSSHVGAFDSHIDRRLLDSVATLVRDTQFIGIRVQSFDFQNNLGFQYLDFVAEPEYVLGKNEARAFSPAHLVSFSNSHGEKMLQTSTKVDLKSAN